MELEVWRALFHSNHHDEQLPPYSTGIFTKYVLDHYSQRPTSMETTSLADFVAWYNFSKQARKGVVHNEDVEMEFDDDSSSDCQNKAIL